MSYTCGDNRFDIIQKAKDDLLEATNIAGSQDEMKVLDSVLFRAWQMVHSRCGWHPRVTFWPMTGTSLRKE